MNASSIATLYRMDLRSLLRDRRTVLLSVVVPIVVLPLMLFASSAMEQRRQVQLRERTYTYAIAGESREIARQTLQAALASTPRAAAADGDEGDAPLKFQESATADPAASLKSGDIDVYVEALTGDAARKAADEERERDARRTGSVPRAGDATEAQPPPAEDAPALAIYYRSNSNISETAADSLRSQLEGAREGARARLLAARGFPVAVDDAGVAEYDDLAGPSQVVGSRVAKFVTALLVFLMMVGGATVASDVIAGEKERGTLETLLTTAAGRDEIIAAKLLVVMSVTLVIVLLEIASALIYAALKIVHLPKGFETIVTPQTGLALLVLYLPVALLLASILLFISGYAKTYKEAQLYFFPVNLLAALMGTAALLPGISLRSAIVVVPIANVSVAVKEVLVGRYDWPMLAVAWLATAYAAAYVARKATRLLASEQLVTNAESDAADLQGGPAVFPKRVLRWFAVLWVAIFAASGYAGGADIRVQVAINLLGIFLGGSLLILRIYRLDPREALALRGVKPAVWFAVLLGAPSALVVALGVARLASYVLPVPPQVLQDFGKNLLPEAIPTWQLLLFIAVLPGICEEIAFRGLLLHGLRRRLRPVALCLAVGLIFALFHFALFRLVSTAFLGVLLSALVVMTGSILPGMLWHALNNGIMVLAAGSFKGELPLWASAVALVPLLCSFWIVWRNRTPYPGLRT